MRWLALLLVATGCSTKRAHQSIMPPMIKRAKAVAAAFQPGSLSLSWESTNRVFEIISSTDLVDWAAIGITTNLTFLITNNEPHRFYRVGAVIP